MKLLTWMNLNHLTPIALAKLLKISHALVYKYLYGKAIPRPKRMTRIYILTLGAVRADDFYDLTPALFEQKSLNQK